MRDGVEIRDLSGQGINTEITENTESTEKKMTMAEHRETDARVTMAWNSGFSFGWWVGLVVGAGLAAVGFFGLVKVFGS